MKGYIPEPPVKDIVQEIVTDLLERYDTNGDYNAEHITSVVMKIAPAHRIGSTQNKSTAAAIIYNVSRICGLYRGSGVPVWTQLEISRVAGIADCTLRNAARRIHASETVILDGEL